MKIQILPSHPIRRTSVCALSFCTALLLVGCGSTDEKAENGPSDEEFRENWTVMQDSTEWKAAYARHQQCMRDAGYPSIDSCEGVVLKDGTLHKPELGQSFAYTGAYLEYRVDTERCSAQSGLDAVRQQFGTSDPTPNPNLIRSRNHYGTLQAACLAQKGWEIPEPVTVKGALVWDVQLDSAEEKDAYSHDQLSCNVELFGTPGFPN